MNPNAFDPSIVPDEDVPPDTHDVNLITKVNVDWSTILDTSIVLYASGLQPSMSRFGVSHRRPHIRMTLTV